MQLKEDGMHHNTTLYFAPGALVIDLHCKKGGKVQSSRSLSQGMPKHLFLPYL